MAGENKTLDAIAENVQALVDFFVRRKRFFAPLLAILTAAIAVPMVVLFSLPTILSWFSAPLDMSKDLYAVNRPIAFTFLDQQGREVGHRGALIGKRLALSEMPSYLPAAFIAMEDRNFYSHGGFDPRGLMRAAWLNFRAGHVVAGGSTITQQTVKIVFLSQDRTWHRKFAELFQAAALEKALTKDEILALYLNRIYLGGGAYGVDGAAHVYFNKSAKDLTLAEAAMLATLTRAPSVFTPRRDLPKAQARAAVVLRAMVETGAITQAEADDAIAHPAVIANGTAAAVSNYYFDTAADEAVQLATGGGGAPNVDLIVTTTMEPRIQAAARIAAQRVIAKSGRKMHASEAAVVVMKPDGAVVAMVGGLNYEQSTFNRITQAHRQPGSAFKPFVYLAALESGLTPWDMRADEPVDINGWTPTNYGGRSFGTLTLADALAHSVNTITANLAQEVGVSSVVQAAQRLGIQSPLVENASIALGTSEVTPMELTKAYAAFANGGQAVTPYLVTKVQDVSGRVLYERKPPDARPRVIADHVDKDLVAMLYGVTTHGTGMGAAVPGHETAGKTGTTQDFHDAWFVGFTHDYVAAVWVGNDDSTPMKSVTGGTLPAQIWKATMTVAETGLPSTPLDKSPPQPPNYDSSTVFGDADVYTPASGEDEESGAGAYYPPGTGYSPPIPDTPRSSDRGDDRDGTYYGDRGQRQGADQEPPDDETMGDRRTFWDWMMDRDRNPPGQPAVPPQPDGSQDTN